jgi:hypothetical protein
MRNDLDELTDLTTNMQRRTAFATFVQELTKSDGDPFMAADALERRLPGSRFISMARRAAEASVTKTAVSAMGTGASGGVLLTGELAAGLIAAATPFSVVDRGGFQRVPFNQPIPIADTLIVSGMTDAGHAKPLRKGTFDTTTLRRRTCAAIIVVPVEFSRVPQALPMLSALLGRGNGSGFTRAFISEIIVGATPVSPSMDPAADLRALLAAYVAGGGGMETAIVVMSSANAAAAKLRSPDAFRDLNRQGGFVAGLPAIASDAVGDVFAVLDSARILVADSGEVAVDIARNATLEMSDSPSSATLAGSPAGPVPTTQVSLWQNNAIGLRCERFVNWQALDGAVAYLNADYLA